MSSTVVRAERNRNYKTIHLAHIDDKRLSWKAKGIHTYLISRPDGWKLNKGHMLSLSPDGQASIDSGLIELKECGYLTITQENGEDGKICYVWTVHESPYPEKPCTVKPCTVNRPLNIEEGNTKESNKREKEKVQKEKETGPEDEVFEYWKKTREEKLNLSGPEMLPTKKRMGKIRARLEEGYSVEQLKEAVDGLLSNEFNVEQGFTDAELCFRDQAHVEQYRSWRKVREEKAARPVSKSAREYVPV